LSISVSAQISPQGYDSYEGKSPMSFADTFLRFFRKESQARVVTSIRQIGKPVTTPANYESFAHFGYQKNAVVFMAVSKIATACAGIEWVLYKKKTGRRANWQELETHPLLDLWDKPNPMQSMSDFIESCIGFLKISGNLYIEANKPSPNRPPLELWPVRPDKMRIVPGYKGYPSRFEFSCGGVTRAWPVDQVNLQSDIMHLKLFHPANDWYGMSPLEAALLAVDQYNTGQKWNLALLQNSATPSGVLQMKVTDANPRGELTNEQFSRLSNELDEKYSGSKNAGRPFLLEGGLEWKSISLSPKDMDFLKSKDVTAQDVALVYGVPPEIIGLGTKTFANYKEARLSFYEETILPTMDRLRDSLNRWLVSAYGDGLYLDYDKDDIDALVEKREQKYTTLQNVAFLTLNEKREASGYATIEGLDIFNIGSKLFSQEELPDVDFEAERMQGGFGRWGGGGDESETEDTEDTEEIDDEKAERLENEKPKDSEQNDIAFKSFNLLNRNEKRKSWQAQNRLRQKIAAGYSQEVKKAFQDLTSRLAKTADKLNTTDARLIEFAFEVEVSEWTKSLRTTLKAQTKRAIETFGRAVLKDGKSLPGVIETKANLKFDSFVTSYVEERSGTQVTTITNTTRKEIRRIISEWTSEAITSGDSVDELSKFLQMEFEGLSSKNAMRIARTEVGLASNNGALAAVKSLEIPTMHKEWVSALDDRTRDDPNLADHASVGEENGEIPIEAYFKVNPDLLMEGPGDPSAPAEQVINCRCVLVFKNKG
jgi:HK97 family phage portal protein